MNKESHAAGESIERRPPAPSFKPIRTLITDWLEEIQTWEAGGGLLKGIPTGLPDLDSKIGGLHRGELTVVAARPSMGKTALVLQIAVHAALNAKLPVLYLSNETSSEGLAMRVLCTEARVDFHRLRQFQLDDSHWEGLCKVAGRLHPADLFLADTGLATPADLERRILEVQGELKGRDLRLGLVIIDSVSAVRLRDFEDGAFLKRLAVEQDVALVALSGIRRELEDGETKRPGLADLWATGSIESYADLVLFVYRDEVYNEDSPDRGLADIIIGKNRHGPMGTVKLEFDPWHTRFKDLSRDWVPEPPPPQDENQVFFACDDGYPMVSQLRDLVRREFPGGGMVEALLAHPSLDECERDELRHVLKKGYLGYVFGGIFCFQKGDRFEHVDLANLGTLFGPKASDAARLLFDVDHDETPSFSWAALARLLASDLNRLMSFGDGTITNGRWLVKTPETRGLLKLRFAPRGRSFKEEQAKLERLLDQSGFKEGILSATRDEHLLRVEPAGKLVKRADMERLLGVFGASTLDLGKVKVLCRGREDRVILVVEAEARAVVAL